MPFAKGQVSNPNGTPNKPFLDALKRAIAQNDAKKLRNAAEKLLTAAANGEPWAVKELRDTLDGKPAQTMQGPGPDGSHRFEVTAPWMAKAAGNRGWD